ncbi:hypothetical protein [Desulfitobacterium sp.]|uniref:hypothetical protein n=1 Tax=Desulfitobacterium sp. TaxID=49981 RepID=UPI002C2AD4E3|nr:hypothetical protein [Desulfitobacterium sp.]HVJ48844.1 hypothetical protein [Desulfitobacterium sp.]
MNRNENLVILSEQLEYSDVDLDPLTQKIFLKFAKRSEQDNRADVSHLRQAVTFDILAFSSLSLIHTDQI